MIYVETGNGEAAATNGKHEGSECHLLAFGVRYLKVIDHVHACIDGKHTMSMKNASPPKPPQLKIFLTEVVERILFDRR